MYPPKDFTINDQTELFSFIKSHAFGQLIAVIDGRPFSCHIPFSFASDCKSVIAHIAKNNPLADCINNQEILITLDGPHGYISPSWYLSSGVPTWNYQSVHINGICKTFTDSARLEELVVSLTNEYESNFDMPWTAQFNPAMLNAIVGLEIEISDIQGIYKLSQNRSDEDRASVIKHLDQLGFKELSQVMKKNLA